MSSYGEESGDRLVAAAAVLREAGLGGRVSAAGEDGTVLAVHTPPGELAAVRRCVPRLRDLGFRYVTVELEALG